MSWLASRRRHRLERDTEQRLRRLIYSLKGNRDFYIPAEWVAILGTYKVNAVLAEYGLPAVHEERDAA